jgi:hypothetical protein
VAKGRPAATDWGAGNWRTTTTSPVSREPTEGTLRGAGNCARNHDEPVSQKRPAATDKGRGELRERPPRSAVERAPEAPGFIGGFRGRSPRGVEGAEPLGTGRLRAAGADPDGGRTP